VSGLDLVVAISGAVLVCVSLAHRFGVAPPVLLLAAGVVLGFVPALRQVKLPPQAVLLFFVPMLLG
jgi:CPA1 family monovalent cation:H+ antiporter